MELHVQLDSANILRRITVHYDTVMDIDLNFLQISSLLRKCEMWEL